MDNDCSSDRRNRAGAFVNVTVIVCTYNRCQSLAKALDSVAASVLPDSVGWEVLVVDNNSKDRTREVVETYCRRYPRQFRYLFESKQGKSHALNSGILEARGDVVAFMDDDVIVEPTWLQLLTAPLGSGDCAGVGGRILPARAFVPPKWLLLNGPYSTGSMLALFDLGDQPGELREPPFGTNMAFRKSVFGKYGAFRTDMGPCPGSELRNEDTEFGRRLLAGGERLWYEPSAIVYHAIPEERLERRYFLAFWLDHGRASIREWKKGPPIIRIPREYSWILGLAASVPWNALKWMLTSNSPRRFYRKGFVWMRFGQILEIYRRLVGSMAHTQGCQGPSQIRDDRLSTKIQ
jgi:glycosyltransferase involved in cell wall biosynthesis